MTMKTATKKHKKTAQGGVKTPVAVRGFYRLHVLEPNANGELQVVGDSGWRENQVTNEGFRNYLARLLGGISGSSQITHLALGTGGAPAASDTSLSGELTDAATCRVSVTAATSSSSKAVTFTGTLASGITTASHNISNIGLFATSTTNSGTIFAGAAYSSSALATNQVVNMTYTISFS